MLKAYFRSHKSCKAIARTGVVLAVLLIAACAGDQLDRTAGWPELSAQQKNRLSQYEAEQLEADRAFARQQYGQAKSAYLILARRGDKFAQYRLAVMHAEGLGQDRDLALAHAWAVLAAQLGQPPFIEFRDRLAARLTPETQARATGHLLELEPQYGLISTSKRQNSKLVRKMRSCTGSRLGSTCANLQALGSFRDADGNAYSSGFAFWRAAREQIAAFHEFMETNPKGLVTLRDLELKDNDSENDPNRNRDRTGVSAGDPKDDSRLY
ncbi:MAG: hypothetical protein ABR550_02415 [Wenzhouxiangellaceae bacterium]